MVGLRNRIRVSYGVVALVAVILGIARAALASNPSNDRCYLETVEQWSWAGPVHIMLVQETLRCRDDGCAAAGGGCPATPAAWSPTNVGDQNGDGQDDFEYRHSCECTGLPDGDPLQSNGHWCETVSVDHSWMDPGSADKITVECLNWGCTSCAVYTELDPAEPEWPNPFKRIQSCQCN